MQLATRRSQWIPRFNSRIWSGNVRGDGGDDPSLALADQLGTSSRRWLDHPAAKGHCGGRRSLERPVADFLG
ncbi:hypothetical protein VMCG_01184 [Cytospora schulzeri]|uniref:Uncharacterized protein n=1 Tax=Cytospora schulzeri TaxID=448051 RepID=A0A423X6A1_9PEZI|nr:hypothetical protein VMCG_01184 [Valsa malicola]